MRKLLTFIKTLFNSKTLPHVRFGRFLGIYSFLWLGIASLVGLGLVNVITQEESTGNPAALIVLLVISMAFFFYYRHTSKVLRSYSDEEAKGLDYLKFVTPVAPVIYFSTVLLVIFGLLNVIMFIIFLVGVMLFVMGVIVTLGFALFNDEYTLNNFVAFPKSFFHAENYFFENILSPQILIGIFVLLYFIIPFGMSTIILIKHYSTRKGIL